MTLLPPSRNPVTGPVLLEVSDIAAVVVRHHRIAMSDIRNVFDRSFGLLRQAIREGAVVPNGPAFGHFSGDPRELLDLEVGFPAQGTPTEFSADGLTATPGTIPGTPRMAAVSHVGSYDGLAQAWPAFIAWASEQGTPRGDWIEVYVSDPSQTPEDQMRTDLLFPLR